MCLLVFSVLLFSVSSDADDIECYLCIPGVTGDIQKSELTNLPAVTDLEYNLPGIPPPCDLMEEAPDLSEGYYQAGEITDRNIFILRPVDENSPLFEDAFRRTVKFPEWKLALCCEKSSSPYMVFTLKGVEIAKIVTGGELETLKIRFERIEWEYDETAIR